jgi:ketosteroid isomerase-like protein
MKDEQVRVYGDVALVIGISDWSFRPSADTTPASGRQRTTSVFRRSPEGWKIIHAHGSPLKAAGG